jgi:hypothetical protein
VGYRPSRSIRASNANVAVVEMAEVLGNRLDKARRHLDDELSADWDLTRSATYLVEHKNLLDYLDQDQLKHLRRSLRQTGEAATQEIARLQPLQRALEELDSVITARLRG